MRRLHTCRRFLPFFTVPRFTGRQNPYKFSNWINYLSFIYAWNRTQSKYGSKPFSFIRTKFSFFIIISRAVRRHLIKHNLYSKWIERLVRSSSTTNIHSCLCTCFASQHSRAVRLMTFAWRALFVYVCIDMRSAKQMRTYEAVFTLQCVPIQ